MFIAADDRGALFTSTNRFQASHVHVSPVAGLDGLGSVVRLPALSCTGSTQAVPTVSLIPVISLTGLWVRS